MEWGQQMKKHEIVANDSMYHNPNSFNIRDKIKTLTIFLSDFATTTTNHSSTTFMNSDHISFSVDLQEPLIIDKLSDIYLNFMLTYNTYTIKDAVAFIMNIDQFNINSNSNNSDIYNGILIPNEEDKEHSTKLHKSKKLNYICSINPCKLYQITGNIKLIDQKHNSSVIFRLPRDLSTYSHSAIVISTSAYNTYDKAYDLGNINTTGKYLFLHANTPSGDNEITIYRTNHDGTLLTKSVATADDSDNSYYNNVDDGTSTDVEGSIEFDGTLLEGIYYIVTGTFNFVPIPDAPISTTNISDITHTQAEFIAGTHTLDIKTVSGGSTTESISYSGSGDCSAWFKFTINNSIALASEFNIIERE